MKERTKIDKAIMIYYKRKITKLRYKKRKDKA